MEVTGEGAAARKDVPFALKAVPIVIAIVLAAGIPFLSLVTVESAKLIVRLPERPFMPWIVFSYGHAVQFGFALLAIRLLGKRGFGDFGLHLPELKSYVMPALGWGLVFGVAMTLLDYWPDLLTQKPPTDQPYPLSFPNVVGWLLFTGLIAAPSSEVLFRGLIVTYLARRMPGRALYRGYAMNGAGIVAAVIYAFSYSESFLTRPFSVAVGQLLYGFAFGAIAAYWFEKSKSLLAPVIAAGVSGIVKILLIFTMVAAWS